MGIACVPHLPQKIFSHFLCEGLCHSHGIGHGIGIDMGLCHSHGIGHFIGLGLSLKIFKSRSLSLHRSRSLSRSKTKKNSAEAESFSKGQSGHRISHNLNSSTIGSHNRFRTFKNNNRRTQHTLKPNNRWLKGLSNLITW